MKMICFDMDGTIADFYSVDGWLDYLRDENPYPYLIARPMWDMEKLREVLLKLAEQGWEIRVISWLAKDSSEEYKNLVRQAKLAWLSHHNFPVHKVHLVSYGTTKADCVRRYYDEQPMILVDDNRKVREGWHLGDTINPAEIEDLPKELEKLLDNANKE